MPTEQQRSISSEENYATYLGLPLLELNRHSWGRGDFRNAYFTNNGKILVIIDGDSTGNFYWQHPMYLTDLQVGEGLAILYRCPVEFEEDITKLINSQYSKISEKAKELIYQYSTLHVDSKVQRNTVYNSKLILVIRHEEEGEIELPLREQDIMNNVDADLSF